MTCTFCLLSCQGSDDLPTDWIKIPIQSCIESNESIIGEVEVISHYCECMIPEIYNKVKKDRQKVAMMRKGDLEFIKLSNDASFMEISKKCRPEAPDVRNKAKIADVILPHMERGIKIGLRDEMMRKGMADQMDIDAYCDCMIQGIKNQFTMNEFGRRDVETTTKYKDLDQKCQSTHKK